MGAGGMGRSVRRKRRFMIVSTARFRVGGEKGMDMGLEKDARKWRKVGDAVIH